MTAGFLYVTRRCLSIFLRAQGVDVMKSLVKPPNGNWLRDLRNGTARKRTNRGFQLKGY